MIAHLRGVIAEKSPTRVVFDVSGVGYELLIPVSTFEKMKDVGAEEKLLTYQHIRQDTLQLFGFSTKQEKSIFLNLISVSGVGPKLAIGILSGCPAESLRHAIVNREVAALTRLPGVGKKTAERLILELREKMEKEFGDGEVSMAAVDRESMQKSEEALLALVSLGYQKGAAEKVLGKILSREADLPLDELVKRALQNF